MNGLNTSWRFSAITSSAMVGSMACWSLHSAVQELPGIPEPGLVMYGSVNNTNPSGNSQLSSGIINWTVSGSGSTLSVPTTIVSVNSQYFYIAFVPFETRRIGTTVFAPTPNTLELVEGGTNYTRWATVNSSNAVITFSFRGYADSFPFGGGDRGTVERVDLAVNLKIESFQEWALRIFGTTNIFPNADADGDGVSNYQEYLAGTDPLDLHSLFIITDIRPDPLGGIDIRWQSVVFKTYELLRSSDFSRGSASVQAGIAATPPTNFFHDTTASGAGPYYYRVKLENLLAPLNPAIFKIIDILPGQFGGIDIRWQSAANKTYSVYRSTNLSQGFINIQAAIPATAGTNSFHDATATGPGPYFYRVKLQ